MANTNPKYVFEVLEAAAKASKKEDKIKILKQHESWALKDVLRGTYDDVVVWLLPGGTPPYNPCDPHNAPSNLLKQNTQFKYFVKGAAANNLPSLKREVMFIRLIESIHPRDADVVLNMVNKKKITGVTKALVQEAFPGLIVK